MQDYMKEIRKEVRGISLRIMLDTNLIDSNIEFVPAKEYNKKNS